MFTIADGRDRFYQWDLNVRLHIDSDKVSQVHFIRACMAEPLTVEVDTSGDVPSVEVPNILLQTYGGMTVYAYVKDGDSQYTKAVKAFRIEERPKPVDYVYTETEVKSYSDLEKRIKALESGSGGADGLNSTVKSLLITILLNGVYSTDQSDNITMLEAALNGSSDEEEQPENGIVQTGSVLLITSGVSVTQTDSTLAIA